MSQQSQGQTFLISGRIVWKSGDLFKGQPETIFGTRQPKLDASGKQSIQYGFGLAVSKNDPELSNMMKIIQSEALKIYPSGHVPSSFAYKYKDGDGIDDRGVPFNKREGYAGNIVFAISTKMPIKYFKYENGQNVQVNEGIKCGDFVRVQLNIKAHGAVGQGKPGMYLNPIAVQLTAYGTEIISVTQLDADSIFGNTAPVVPQGGSSTPIAPSSFPMQQPVQPNYNVLPQVHQPQGFPQQPMMQQQPMQPAQPQQAMPAQQGFGFPFNQQ